MNHSITPRIARFAAAAAGTALLVGTLAGCSSAATVAARPTTVVTVTPTSAPSSAKPVSTPTPAPTVDAATLLLSAPVPAVCQHPAGTLAAGTLPGQAASSGYVKLSSLVDTAAGPYDAAGTVTGIAGTAIAASITCNAGGVPWPDVIAFYRVDGSALDLVGSYSLDTLSKRVATTSTVSISGGSAVVTWTGPGADQPDADGSLKQAAKFTLSGSNVVASGYTATAG